MILLIKQRFIFGISHFKILVDTNDLFNITIDLSVDSRARALRFTTMKAKRNEKKQYKCFAECLPIPTE